MARTTGTLQQVSSELLRDEVNHATQFSRLGVWIFTNRGNPLKRLSDQVSSLPEQTAAVSKPRSRATEAFYTGILVLAPNQPNS